MCFCCQTYCSYTAQPCDHDCTALPVLTFCRICSLRARDKWMFHASTSGSPCTTCPLQAEMCSDSFQLLGMAQRGFLPAVLARRSQHGTPTLAIILSSVGVMALVRCDARRLCQPAASGERVLLCTQRAIGRCTADLRRTAMPCVAQLLCT